MDFDVTKYELDDTSVLTLKDARGDDMVGADGKNPVLITLHSPGSPEGVKALHKSSRQTQRRVFKSMRGEFDPKDAENADREQAEKLAAFTVSIENFPVAPLAFYSNTRLLHFHRQVSEHIDKLGNFSKGSSPS